MNLQEIENLKIFEVIGGSHAYGTKTPDSDVARSFKGGDNRSKENSRKRKIAKLASRARKNNKKNRRK